MNTEQHMLDVFQATKKLAERTGHTKGPLEAIDSPSERMTQRLSQAFAMVSLIMADEIKAFDTLNDTIRLDYLAGIKQLIAEAMVDLEVMT